MSIIVLFWICRTIFWNMDYCNFLDSQNVCCFISIKIQNNTIHFHAVDISYYIVFCRNFFITTLQYILGLLDIIEKWALCQENHIAGSIWYNFVETVNFINSFLPMTFITISTIIIIYKLKIISFNRKIFISSYQKRNLLETKTLKILIITGIIYTVVMFPYQVCVLLSDIFQYEWINSHFCSVTYLIYFYPNRYLGFFRSFYTIVRFAEQIIFFVMIKEFRQAVYFV